MQGTSKILAAQASLFELWTTVSMFFMRGAIFYWISHSKNTTSFASSRDICFDYIFNGIIYQLELIFKMKKTSSAFYPKAKDQNQVISNQWDMPFQNPMYQQHNQMFNGQYPMNQAMMYYAQGPQGTFGMQMLQMAQNTQVQNMNTNLLNFQNQQPVPQQQPQMQHLQQQMHQMNLQSQRQSQSQTYNSLPNKNNFHIQQNSESNIQQECPDYNLGFCVNGPQCPKIHNKKEESKKPKTVPEWYIRKVNEIFDKNQAMTNQSQLMDFIFTSLAEKFRDTQSINFSNCTFSDVRSERSEPFYYNEILNEIENTRNLLKGRTRFFIIKSFSMENIKVSIEQNVWSTTPGPTTKLTKAFHNADHVILIFSVNESRSFQGFAVMESDPDPDYKPQLFVADNSSIQYSNNFKVKWIVTCDYPFTLLSHLPPNPMNENMPIKQSKNGQELPFKMGNYLCYLLYNFEDKSKRVLTPLETYCQNAPQPHHHTVHIERQQNNTQKSGRQTDMRRMQGGKMSMPIGCSQQRSRQQVLYNVKSQQVMHQQQLSPRNGEEEKKETQT